MVIWLNGYVQLCVGRGASLVIESCRTFLVHKAYGCYGFYCRCVEKKFSHSAVASPNANSELVFDARHARREVVRSHDFKLAQGKCPCALVQHILSAV